MSSGFEIQGMEGLLRVITEMHSGNKAKRIRKEALNAGGNLAVNQLKKNFESFQDKGYSRDEIVRSDARTKNDVEELKIGWNGEHGRWRLIHLNEFGYSRKGKQYTPKGFGVIGKTIMETKDEYAKTVREELKKSL